jgi:hypothetical protein
MLMLPNTSFGATGSPDILTGKRMTLPMFVNINNGAGTGFHLRGRLPDMMAIPLSATTAGASGVVIRDTGAIAWVNVGSLWIPATSEPIFS